jgi:ribonucleoside-diphosphate reductase alpha chain
MKRRVLHIKGNGEQETPLDAYERVADFVAIGHKTFNTIRDTEIFRDKVVEMLGDGKFMPNTPTLVNAGYKNAQCSACFVLPIDDNLPSIYKAHHDQGLIQASGGGTGFFLGDIRAAGTKAAGRFITRGPINWLRMLNENAVHVAQGMRDGANMAILDVGHPDIIEFIKCKQRGYGLSPELLSEQLGIDIEEAKTIKAIAGIEKFNISVSIPNHFMKALENGGDWYFIDPHTKQKTGSMPAQEIWDLIVQNAWEHGEPGIVFPDTANAHNFTKHLGLYRATNPCVSGDTLIQTDRGLERMASFVEEARSNAQVLGKNGQWRGVKKFMNNGVKPIWKITTRSGYSVKATEYHKFPVEGKGEIQLKDIKIDDVLRLQNHNIFDLFEDKSLEEHWEYELLGWIVGDGYLSGINTSHKAGLIVGNKDEILIPQFIEAIELFTGAKCKPYKREEYNTTQLLSMKIWNWAVNKMGAHPVKSKHKRVPEAVWTASGGSIKAFLRGLFSADGHVRTNKKGSTIVLSSKSLGLIQDVQILFSMFGCRTTIMDRSRPARDKVFKHVTPDGEVRHYGSDGELYELFLYGKAKLLFRNDIGFTFGSYKQEKLVKIPAVIKRNQFRGLEDKDHVISIEYVGEEEVFDVTVDDTDLSMINNGIVTIDCGEQWRRPDESCNLGHINLSKFVIGANGSSTIDWTGIEDAARFGVQFLDNIVEINTFPIPELTKMNELTRNIGLGVMGWADMLAMLGILYDSTDAINLADEVGTFFKRTVEDETTKLGKDRGNFPGFEGSEFEQAGLKWRRNNDTTTVAPTGQTSMYVGCSGSIEPIIFPIIKREQAGIVQIDYHPALFNILRDRGLDNEEVRDKLGNLGSVRKALFLPEEIRAVFPSSHDVSYDWHIKHQIAWQKNISSGVSKTINLHKEAPKLDVDKAFRLAYGGGCKGITVYRDGTRSHQPLSSLKRENGGLVKIGNKRDQVTIGTNRKVPNGCGNMMIYVGEGEDGRIQEITARLGKGGGCASAQVEAIARMASIAIQHNAEPAYIAKQLSGIRCHLTALYRSKHTGDRPRTITSCSDAISVALDEHLLNGSGEKLEHDNNAHVGACPDCGSQLSYTEGCCKCLSCGFSRC